MRSAPTSEYKRLISLYGQKIINELDKPDNYKAVIYSFGNRYLGIVNKSNDYEEVTIHGKTYRELFEAVQAAWWTHALIVRKSYEKE